ncbi:MAG: nucleotide-binding protein [Thermoguttaceae bacterium]|nr:nucleotide-binding protein [Thermoguttaceae bacterium]MBQ6828559.1 nucleotide-binding protein [Thermoguttaceae bacterium]
MAIQMSYDELYNKLKSCSDVQITEVGEDANSKRIYLNNGGIVVWYHTGSCVPQGKNQDKIRAILESDSGPKNRKIFVVYGHDEAARNSLELVLRRWKFDPVIFDRKLTTGQTLIEKFESCASQVSYAIVLATPDDYGQAKDSNELKLRVRQNVLLELGYFWGKLGRERITILLKKAENFEGPSDINGLIYVPYSEVKNHGIDKEAEQELAKRLDDAGYKIEIGNL